MDVVKPFKRVGGVWWTLSTYSAFLPRLWTITSNVTEIKSNASSSQKPLHFHPHLPGLVPQRMSQILVRVLPVCLTLRALDNQLFVATVSPARDPDASYVAWGHSMVVNPWGTVIASAEADEKIVYADLDLGLLHDVRRRVPVLVQKRLDLYQESTPRL